MSFSNSNPKTRAQPELDYQSLINLQIKPENKVDIKLDMDWIITDFSELTYKRKHSASVYIRVQFVCYNIG